MRFVQRDFTTGLIVGHFANEQDYAKEQLEDDHPDLVAYRVAREANRGLTVTEELSLLKARVEDLERKTRLMP